MPIRLKDYINTLLGTSKNYFANNFEFISQSFAFSVNHIA